MKLPEKYNDKSNEIKWTHSSSDAVIERKNKKTKSNTPGLTMEEDGSLRFQSVGLKDTGTYIYTVTSSDGTEIAKDKVEIKVYGSTNTYLAFLAGGGVLLLLLICVLIICACRRRQRRKKHQQDEKELAYTPGHTGTNRSKQTAREKPARLILQEDPMPQSPSPQTSPKPKAQIRARPPPPPQDEDEENPTPIPHPRTKLH
ncbi:hypothetical protein DPX16_5198 [Anabarilius grahami]|uniref:T cell CD4 receptor C-terminal region domain-containing protein n=1 Tax=Anabarilius grahami TaxID=495550 RepID=A0A3N0XL77_ANAGA|nr:hypothetical protein DPX16_5198 [Anabarilius grahami]